MSAAEALFLEQGYQNTTLAAVVQKSGGSLATLYQHFGNKQGLLRAIITRMAYENRPPIPSSTPSLSSRSEELRVFARALYTHLTAPHTIALARMVLSESLRDQAFASSLYDEMHVTAIDDLANVFALWDQQGEAVIDDPRAAAELFLTMLASDTQMRALCTGAADEPSHAELTWRLNIFLTHFKID